MGLKKNQSLSLAQACTDKPGIIFSQVRAATSLIPEAVLGRLRTQRCPMKAPIRTAPEPVDGRPHSTLKVCSYDPLRLEARRIPSACSREKDSSPFCQRQEAASGRSYHSTDCVAVRILSRRRSKRAKRLVKHLSANADWAAFSPGGSDDDAFFCGGRCEAVDERRTCIRGKLPARSVSSLSTSQRCLRSDSLQTGVQDAVLLARRGCSNTCICISLRSSAV